MGHPGEHGVKKPSEAPDAADDILVLGCADAIQDSAQGQLGAVDIDSGFAVCKDRLGHERDCTPGTAEGDPGNILGTTVPGLAEFSPLHAYGRVLPQGGEAIDREVQVRDGVDIDRRPAGAKGRPGLLAIYG